MIDLLENSYCSFVNMDHRNDRLVHMRRQLAAAGIVAHRTRGMRPEEVRVDRWKVSVMWNRTKGAIGCHFSQVKVMMDALDAKKHAFVMEDDLIFCADIQRRLEHIDRFTKANEWDVIWLGGTFHVNPAYWHTGRNPDLAGSSLGRDAQRTDDPRMIRTFGAFSTYAYIVNEASIPKILTLLDKHVHESMGIDWLFIKLQPQLQTFAFVPGCVKQMDNKSDIGKGLTIFSNFSRLNGTKEKSAYWWQNKLEDFNPETFNWAEASIR